MEKEPPVLERMKQWIQNITFEYRTPEESYQIVCDDYPDFKRELRAKLDTLKTNEEKNAYQNVLALLDQGTNSCHNWCCQEDCMDHFQSISRQIRLEMSNLEDMNY